MAANSQENLGNAFLSFFTFGIKGKTATGKAESAANAAERGKIFRDVGGFFSEMMDKGSEMLSGRNAEGQKTALGQVMRPALYIMAAIGAYKLFNAAVNYFETRSGRKRVENANKTIVLSAENMERMAFAREMEMKAEAIHAQFPAGALDDPLYHQEKYAPGRRQIQEFRKKLENDVPDLEFSGRQN